MLSLILIYYGHVIRCNITDVVVMCLSLSCYLYEISFSVQMTASSSGCLTQIQGKHFWKPWTKQLMLHERKLRFNKFTLIAQYHSLLSVHWVLSNKYNILSPKIETCCVITGLVFLSGKKIFRFSELATPHYIGARAQWQNRKIIIKKVFKINEADHSGTVPEQFFMCHRKRGHKRHVFLWLFDWSYWHVHSVTQ